MKRPLLLCAGALFFACGGNSSAPADAGSDAGADAGFDAGPTWSAAVLVDADGGAGLDLTAAVDPSGRPAVAYFTRRADCDYTLAISREATDGVWSTEVLPSAQDGGVRLTGHYGVALSFDPNGNPVVAYLGGNPSDTKPGAPNDGRWHCLQGAGDPLPADGIIAYKDGAGWHRQTIATLSDSIVSTTHNVDNIGTVTGLWPSLAIGPTGAVHSTLRDIHFGADASAYQKSNLEYRQAASLGGAKTVGEMVVPSVDDMGGLMGAGTYVRMALWNGNPVVSFALSDQLTDDAKEIWFAARSPSGGWTKQQLSNVQGRPGHGPSLASSASGLAIAFLDAAEGDLLVATSSDGTTFSVGAVEALGETGYHPAAGYAGSTLGVLYAYCRAKTDPSTQCNSASNQLRFRVNTPGGWANPEALGALVPDSTALVGDGVGHFVAIYKDPAGGLKAQRRSP